MVRYNLDTQNQQPVPGWCKEWCITTAHKLELRPSDCPMLPLTPFPVTKVVDITGLPNARGGRTGS